MFDKLKELLGMGGTAAQDAMQDTSDAMSNAADSMADTAGNMADGAMDMASDTANAMGDMASAAAEEVSEMANSAASAMGMSSAQEMPMEHKEGCECADGECTCGEGGCQCQKEDMPMGEDSGMNMEPASSSDMEMPASDDTSGSETA